MHIHLQTLTRTQQTDIEREREREREREERKRTLTPICTSTHSLSHSYTHSLFGSFSWRFLPSFSRICTHFAPALLPSLSNSFFVWSIVLLPLHFSPFCFLSTYLPKRSRDGGLHSTEVAFLLLTQRPRVWFLAFPKNFTQCCWDLSMVLVRGKWTEAWKCWLNPCSY